MGEGAREGPPADSLKLSCRKTVTELLWVNLWVQGLQEAWREGLERPQLGNRRGPYGIRDLGVPGIPGNINVSGMGPGKGLT